MNPWDQNLRTQVAERDKKIESLEQELMISQSRSPNEQFKASPSDKEYYDKIYEKLKINKEAGILNVALSSTVATTVPSYC